MIKLFTYGTLQHDDVQENLFGRALQGTPEKLIGYVLKRIQIEEEFGIMDYLIIAETKNAEDVPLLLIELARLVLRACLIIPGEGTGASLVSKLEVL